MDSTPTTRSYRRRPKDIEGAEEPGDIEALADLETSAEFAGLDLAGIRADLHHALAADTGRGQGSARAHAAQATYDGAVEDSVIAPLVRSALEESDPLVAAAVIQAVELLRLSHRMGPALQELLRCSLETSFQAGAQPVHARVVDRYLTIGRQACSLLGALDHMRKHS